MTHKTYSPPKPVLVLLPLLVLLSLGGCNRRPAKIADFTASPASVNSGEKAQLCYELVDATGASIDPSVGALTEKTKSCLNVEPAQTTNYTLFATGADGQTVTRQVTVNVAPLPEPTPLAAVTLFEARRGDGVGSAPKSPADLCYEVRGASSVSIEPEVGVVESVESGCRTVKPERTRVYTLTATGSDGRPASKQATVTVEQPPAKILKYDVSPVAINAGESVRICYQVEGASSAAIENVTYQVKLREPDCVSVKPTRTVTFALVARNLDGQAVRSNPAVVTVKQPPAEIVDFSAHPPEVELGNQTSIHYEVSNADNVQIAAAGRTKDFGRSGKGDLPVTLAQTITFTLNVRDLDGKPLPARRLTVNVVPRQQALVKSFDVTPADIIEGRPAQLCYEAISSRASIGASTGVGFPEVNHSGGRQCLSVKPVETTIYTLTAVGLNGQPEIRQTTLNVRALPKPPAEILRFAASSPVIVRGQTVELSYGVRNATSASIQPGPVAVASNGTGSLRVTPRVTTTYELKAVGLDGMEKSRLVNVQVYPPLEISDFAVRLVNNRRLLCYEFHGASRAWLGSPPSQLPVSREGDGKQCLTLPTNPAHTYTINVQSPWKSDSRTINVP